MKKVLPVDASLLLDPSKASNLFSAESGKMIERLNDELDKRSLALAHMGAYDGQTLAGAISTGTHGTGISSGRSQAVCAPLYWCLVQGPSTRSS